MRDLVHAAALFAAIASSACSAPGTGTADSPDGTRGLKVFSSIGKEVYVLDGCREAELLSHEGKGCLTYMWFGGDWEGYHRTRIRVYVDGETTASIDMELGLGHGYGFGEEFAPWVTERMGKTGARSPRSCPPASRTTSSGPTTSTAGSTTGPSRA